MAGCFNPAEAQEAAKPSLGAIRAVTITAADLAAVEAAWTKFMGYKLVRRGTLNDATAASWGAPRMRGERFIILAPESGETFFLRFVEQATPEGFDPAQSYGWNATEITVQNSVELYERLKDSPFKVRGPPNLVPTYPYLRAMGAVGPAGERLNLTWITEKRPDLAEAKSFVGRCFIATEMVPDLPAALEFYRTTFGSNPSPIRKLPSLELAVVPLSDGCKIEVDQHKGAAHPRERTDKGLPPGLAIVTFECSAFDKMQGKIIKPPDKATLEPYRGRRTAVMSGIAGELLELVEA